MADFASPGSSVAQDGRLILTVGNIEPSAGAGIHSIWRLEGDFDIQVKYETGPGWGIPDNDHLDGAVLGVMIDGNVYHVVRLLSTNQDGYFLWDGANSTLSKEFPSQTPGGSLRLVRTGEVLTAFYDEGYGWQEVGQTKSGGGQASVYLQIASIQAGQAFTTYFDEFKVNSGEVAD